MTRRAAVIGLLATALLSSQALAVQAPAPGAATATTVKLPSGPGSIGGLTDAANVSPFSGQITYSIPFDLPSGVAGFGPSAALSYDGAW